MLKAQSDPSICKIESCIINDCCMRKKYLEREKYNNLFHTMQVLVHAVLADNDVESYIQTILLNDYDSSHVLLAWVSIFSIY